MLGWVCDRYGARVGVLIGAFAGLSAATWGAVMNRRHADELEEADLLSLRIDADRPEAEPVAVA
jgi:hypothetical protein